MLYRFKYASQYRQERIFKIKLSHEGFQKILSAGISTSYQPSIFPTEEEWRKALEISLVRVWIIGIEGVTELAQAIAIFVKNRTKDSFLAPIEQIYQVNAPIQQALAMIKTANC